MSTPDAYPEMSYLPASDLQIDRHAGRPGERQSNRESDRAAQPASAPSMIRADWVVRAQDGQAREVLAEIELAVRAGLEPRSLARALYARALCLMVLGEGSHAVDVARELTVLCRELGLQAAGLQARALLVDLLRRAGDLEQAMEQLAHAVALEPLLRDLSDPEVQVALGALTVALRLSGAVDEANRVERRLAAVEEQLPLYQRVSRWSNLAFEHLTQAMAAARRTPFDIDVDLVDQALVEIDKACGLANHATYHVVTIEAAVLAALPAALAGDAAVGVARLRDCQEVLERGPEATSAQLFWAVGMVRGLVRLGRFHEAATLGARALALVRDHGSEAGRSILAYEVMRAEHPQVERIGSGTAEYLALTEDRVGADFALVSALFRARVDLLRGADERRNLARAASLDPLTGLVNRRGAAWAIAEAAALPAGESVALLLIDLDGFKDVNDNAGHLAGDAVLLRVSTALRTAARVEDVVARWGGDEFVVVAALDEDRALALADRLRDTVRHRAQEAASSPVTASVGIVVRESPLDEETWLRRADEAMYVAKRSGGDATRLG
jgi:diguanylate cyclase (GGDEF)-like protein